MRIPPNQLLAEWWRAKSSRLKLAVLAMTAPYVLNKFFTPPSVNTPNIPAGLRQDQQHENNGKIL